MNQLKEICRIIDVIQDESVKLEKNRAGKGNLEKAAKTENKELFDYFIPRTQIVIAEYERRYKCTNYQARNAFKDAVSAKEKYVSTYDENYKESPDAPFATYVEVTPAGRTLNSKILLRVPASRYNKWLGDHSNLVTFVFGSGVGAVLATGGFIVSIFLRG